MQTPDLCIGRHDPASRPLAHPGSVYCDDCYTTLHRQLFDVATHRAALPAFTQPTTFRKTSNPTGSGKRPSPPAPGRLDVLAAMDPRTKGNPDAWPVDGTLNRWFIHWMRRMGAKPPYNHDPLVQATWMLRSLDWITAHTETTAFHADIRTTARVLRALTADTPPPPAGTCTRTNDGEPCGGPVYLQGRTHIHCRRCGTRTDVADLPATIAQVQPDKPIPIQTAWITERHGIPDRTLRHWANTGRIRRYGRGIVDYGDVQRLIRQEAS